MEVVFNDDDLLLAFKQKQKIFWTYIAVAAVFAVICVLGMIYFVSLPFDSPKQIIPKTIISVATILFVIFSYIFLGIKYIRVRRYYKLISYFSVGMKQVNNSIFLRTEEPETKFSVDFNVLTFSEWSKKKSEYMDRKIYTDKEKQIPPFQKGDIVRYLTQGNVILEYEVIGHDDSFSEEKDREDAEREPIKIGELN